ncbi:MAG: siderophore-interacting protein [Thermomicrobiales bacterium]
MSARARSEARKIETIAHGPMVFRPAEVVRVRTVTPHMVRITLTGEALEGLTSPGVHDDVRIQFPEQFDATPVPPVLCWKNLNVRHAPDGPPSQIRALTIRRFDPSAAELDIEIALHEAGTPWDEERDGILTAWARQAEPGRRVTMAGPYVSRMVPDDLAHYLLIGDEAALPAIGRHVESLPQGAVVTVVAEVTDAADEQVWTSAATVDYRWFHHGVAARGEADRLVEAVQALPDQPPETYAFVGAEVAVAKELRRLLTRERGIEKGLLDATGYWRRREEQPGTAIRLRDRLEKTLFSGHTQSPR